jgi:hypothetical protein
MLKRAGTRLTFIVPAGTGATSVVGDFNGWDPNVHRLRRRSNGTQSVAVDLAPGRCAFRSLSTEAGFFDEPQADAIDHDGDGETHSVLVVEAG